ncbi:OmpA family protein [Luteolibacter sp. SL250]|uniref:OmpA family protein n=1 Tax=Luteolibacter sp. SL250 TaxID=2995170 RepID=UPI00226F0D55|nr:OmpA family protein [Luteolibacter sp. SL250]WAC20639.1 OmpA family protein [Luteolibacter sp. SL250]
MKPYCFLATLLAVPLYAQPPTTVETTVTETVTPGKRVVEETVVERPVAPPAAFDPGAGLRIVPRALPVDEPVPAPGSTVETTETVRSVGGRVYHTERNVVVVEGRELPYITIPVLFVKETAELLDSESRSALDQTAAAIADIIRTNPEARFDVEGHTSVEGAEDMNLNLSAARARRVFDELTQRYRVPAANLSAHGYGETYPNYPNGNESQLTLDRRVLVVRVR